jgi:hypothetical protein
MRCLNRKVRVPVDTGFRGGLVVGGGQGRKLVVAEGPDVSLNAKAFDRRQISRAVVPAARSANIRRATAASGW